MIYETDKEKCLEIINRLVNNGILNEFLSKPSETIWESVEETIEDFFEHNVNVCSGSTKGVIIPHTTNCVIKFPFLGDYFNRRNPDGEGFISVWNVLPNYCERELENYQYALKAGLERHFAEVQFLGTWYDYPIFIQEAADCDEEEISDKAYDSAYSSFREDGFWELDEEDYPTEEDKIDYFSNSFYESNGDDQTVDLVYETYGSKEARIFYDFCELYHINDKHSGNWGYINGELVLVDYSGYGWK